MPFPSSCRKLLYVIAALGGVGLAADLSISLLRPALSPSPEQVPFYLVCLILSGVLALLTGVLLARSDGLEKLLRNYVVACLVLLLLQMGTYGLLLAAALPQAPSVSFVHSLASQDFLLFDFIGFLDALTLPYTVKKQHPPSP